MSMDARELAGKVRAVDPVRGVTLLNVLELPEPVAKLITEVMRRRKVTLAEFAEALGLNEGGAQTVCHLLVEKGFLRVIGSPSDDAELVYRVRFDHSSGRGLASSVWDSLE